MVAFAIHQYESAMGAHVSLHPEMPSHFPPHLIPLGCPRAPALSILHMVLYMFQCDSLKSSHPHLLPHSPKMCSLHLSLFCCLCYCLSKFHIYVLIYCTDVSLSGFLYSVIIGSSFIHLIRTDSNVFFL